MFQLVLIILWRLTFSGLDDFLSTFLPKMFVKFLNFGWVNSNFCPWELFIFSLRSLAPLLPSFSLFLPAEPLLSRPPLAPSLSEISFSCTLLVQSNTGASQELIWSLFFSYVQNSFLEFSLNQECLKYSSSIHFKFHEYNRSYQYSKLR